MSLYKYNFKIENRKKQDKTKFYTYLKLKNIKITC